MFLYAAFHLNLICIHEQERIQLIKIVCGVFNNNFN